MPVSVIVGGQYGSEGKGKVAHYLARERKATVAIRCGGTNSGHTVIDSNGQSLIFRQLPTASILPDVKLVLCAGTYIDPAILKHEIALVRLAPSRLMIDPYAVIITEDHKKREQDSGLVERIASTGSGTGAAVIARIQRAPNLLFAKDVPELAEFIADVSEDLRRRLQRDERIILEGTQGFGLSPLHSRFNPYVTSRDTTAAGFLSEAGLSPFDADEIVMVIRAFPIRVGGDSGPLVNATDWETITREAGYEEPLQEITSVSKRIRRVARFDATIVKRAIQVNKPTATVLNHLDYLSYNASPSHDKVRSFVNMASKSTGVVADYVGFGPTTMQRWRS
ncbi:adenylosuccinate synthetase [Desulfurivibrio sp. D14AmB]|uniref:adenylosuccinate synthetase n=1 Tax=Desulfurivibrio sp. D14AmB TaxID=3374370 RepID=UPI00376EAC55